MSAWRRQRRSLAALLVAAVAVVGVHVWLEVLPATRAEPPVIVAEEGRATVSGQELDLSGTRWDEFDAPAGTRTLSVRLDAAPGADAAGCGGLTLAEVRGDRVWVDARSDLDVPGDAGESFCQEDSGPYRILAVFLLPQGADGPFVLEVPGEDGVARFDVIP